MLHLGDIIFPQGPEKYLGYIELEIITIFIIMIRIMSIGYTITMAQKYHITARILVRSYY